MPALLMAWQVFWGFATSRIGNVVMAAVVAFAFGWHKATVRAQREAEIVQAELQKAYWTELDRQRKVAKEIERKAADRAGEDAVIARAMEKKISDFEAKELANVASKSAIPQSKAAASHPVVSCVVDRDYARLLRDIDAISAGARSPARKARRIR